MTVSNPALVDLFDGTVVPHARDERVFDPALYDREAVRASLGFRPGEKVILFAGTPRAHKGIQAIAEALRAIGNPDYKLCVIGTVTDGRLREQLERFGDLIRLIPYQPFTEMARILTVADLMCVLQDTASPISRYQVPAKVTDAIAMEIPCLVTRTPPVEDFIAREAVHPLDARSLPETIESLLGDYTGTKAQAVRAREIFLAEYSYAAVRPRLEAIIRDLLDEPRPLAAEHERLLAFERETFGAQAPGEPAVGARLPP